MSMLDAALSYATIGWSVFPLFEIAGGVCSCSQGDGCSNPGKHPRTRNGLKDATTDAAQIRTWWSRSPNANIGIATGACSNLIVIDLDIKPDVPAESTFWSWCPPGQQLHTLTATTGRGKHVYFRHPGGRVGNSAGKLAPGVDVRADGGYVVAPCSNHASGATYQWVDSTAPVCDAPEWLMQRLTMPKGTSPKCVALGEGDVGEGRRNSQLYSVACALRGQLALSEDEILERLHLYNMLRCKPPLEDYELARIASNACLHEAEFGSSNVLTDSMKNPLYWMKFDARAYMSDQRIQMMTAEQRGLWLTLRCSAWLNGGSLPDTDGLWRLAGASSRKRFEKVCDPCLAEFDRKLIGGTTRLVHRSLAAQYADTLDKWLQKKQAGAAAAAERKRAKAQEDRAA